MRRASLLHPPSSSRQQRQHRTQPPPMAYAAVESPRSRAFAWTSDPLSPPPLTSPPPYEYHDVFPAIPAPAAYGMDTRPPSLSPLAKVQDLPLLPALPAELPRLSRSRATPAVPPLSIPHLREALHSLETKMASLLSERDLLESKLEQAVRMQSPVQRIPSELLSTIFVIGVLGGEEDTLLLSSMMLVCRYWRDVALDTPVLWSQITMGTRHSLERARLKLDRSKSTPLHVVADFRPRVDNGSVKTDSIMRAMDLVYPAIWRWRSFRLTVPHRPQANAALVRCRESAPLLEVLSVHISHSMQDDHYSHPPLPLFAAHTPNLRSCSFTSFNFSWDPNLLSKLEILKLGGYWNGYAPSVDVILNILRACPHLEELVLRNMSDVDPDSNCSILDAAADLAEFSERIVRVRDTRMIQLPHLKKAYFYYSGPVRTRTILSFLSCPSLQSIHLCFLDNVSPIVEILRRQSLTSLPLRSLRIEASFFNEIRLVRLLQRLPSLSSLELVDVEDVSPHLMKCLSNPPASQTWVCPKLTNLSLEGCTSVDWESLRSCVESRLPAQSRIISRQQSSHSLAPPMTRRPSQLPTVSASQYAASAHILSYVPTSNQSTGSAAIGGPKRLQSVDLMRCHQFSKEMLQWLRMYVADVRCEMVKGAWADA